MNRVELAAAGTELQPLERAQAASPVLTAATVFLVGPGGIDIIICAHVGFDLKYEAPVRHDGGRVPVSELLRARHEQMAG